MPRAPDEDQRERLVDQVRADDRADGGQLALAVDRAEPRLQRGRDLAELAARRDPGPDGLGVGVGDGLADGDGDADGGR